MVEKFRELALESKIIIIVLIVAGFFAIILFLSSLLQPEEAVQESEKPASVTEESGMTSPDNTEKNNEASKTEEDLVNEFLEKDTEGEGYPEDAFPEDLLDYSTPIDEKHYQIASDFILNVCNKNVNETFEEIFSSQLAEEKYMNTLDKYEDLKYSELYNTVSCAYLSDTIVNYNETEYELNIDYSVSLTSEVELLNRNTTVKYIINTVKDDDGYHVVNARLANPDFYQ